ncbi:MAG: penicillin-binding protein 2 [Acidobacteria bacterium]|nr:penicillin-binding protein 2 [Acidobacteriota bacterium]
MRNASSAQRHLRRIRGRILVLAFLLGLAATLILARLIRYQILLGDSIRQQARSQQEGVIEILPARGAIYDARGRELALSVQVDSLYVDPSRFADRAKEIRQISRILGISPGTIRTRINRGGSRFAWISRQLSPQIRGRIEKLGLAATGFLPESKRFFPNRNLASHVLGYVGIDNKGLAGLEYGFNSKIQGKPGHRFAYRDARGVKIPMEIDQPATEGRSLVITLDKVIQHIVEKELSSAVRKTGARAGMAVLMDPDRGTILALANQPTFDPNRFASFPEAHRRNRAVTDCFEPGSTFKVFTYAAAWQDRLIRDGEKIDCLRGSIRIAGRTIRDHHPYDLLTPGEILAHSSNVGAILIGQRIPNIQFYRFLSSFGFGAPSGINLPGEHSGILHPPGQWSRTSAASLAIGHEVCVNAVQMTASLTALINGGILRTPRIVRAILDENGYLLEEFAPAEGIQVVQPETSRQLRKVMQLVVETGTGKAARLAKFTVGGKTGTAQKSFKDTGYSSTLFVSSFFGFAPVSRPAIALLIVLDEPKGKTDGGDVAAPVFARIAPKVLHYLRIPPDQGARHRTEFLASTGQRWAPSRAASR